MGIPQNEQIAWLIETTDTVQWWAGGGDEDFTSDSLRAVRLARRCDAEALIVARNLHRCRAVEHAWIPPAPAPHPETLGGLTAFGRVCDHGHLARQCETCEALKDAAEWRVKYEILRDIFRLVREALVQHGQHIDSDDQVAARVNETLIEIRSLRESGATWRFYPTYGSRAIATERYRQLHDHGYSAAHDDHHGPEELTSAAVAYAINTFCSAVPFHRQFWPWNWSAWKPTPADPIHQLTKAGALIAAAIDALQRRLDKRSEPSEVAQQERPR